MNARSIERVVAILDSKEPCCLFECLVAEAFDFPELRPGTESPGLLTARNDV
jgi:hypothetical protein